MEDELYLQILRRKLKSETDLTKAKQIENEIRKIETKLKREAVNRVKSTN